MTTPELQTGAPEAQATLAVFARAELTGEQQEEVFTNIGGVALRLANSAEAPELPGFIGDGYRYFETQQSPDEAESVAYRAELLEGYEPFAADVSRIKTERVDTPSEQVPGYLASGNESDVYVVEREGRQFAVRISRDADDPVGTDNYASGLMAGRGIAGLEQMVGLSYEDAVTVSELLPGKRMEEYTPQEIAAISQEHLDQLAKTVIKAASAGISIDGSGGNMLYDPEHGFGFIDYGRTSSERSEGVARAVTDGLFRMSHWIGRGVENFQYREDYEVLSEVLDTLTPTYERWLTTLDNEMSNQGLQEDFFNYPEMLTEQLAKMKTVGARLHEDGEIDRMLEAKAVAVTADIEKIERNTQRFDPEADGAMIEITIDV